MRRNCFQLVKKCTYPRIGRLHIGLPPVAAGDGECGLSGMLGLLAHAMEQQRPGDNGFINLKTAVEHIPANKNQHKLDKEN